MRHRYMGRCIVGASEVPAVMGASPYKTIIDLAVEKMTPPQVREQNDAMKRGTFLEQGLLDYAADTDGTTIVTPAEMFVNDTGRIISTLDGVSHARLYEAKTTTSWVAGDQPLPEWFWQAQAQMVCTEASSVRFVVLDRHLRISLFDIDADAPAQHRMLQEVEAFCTAIDENRMPTDDPLTADQVSLLHPDASGEIEIGTAGLDLLERWNAIKDAIKELEREEKACKDALANALMDCDTGTVDGHRVITFKTITQERFDSKAFTDQHPDLARQFTKFTTFRTMRTVKGASRG